MSAHTQALLHRALRAAIAQRRASIPRKTNNTVRARRGSLSFVPAVWRHGVAGTNRITCIGGWKTGTRRQSPRANRFGETDWHRPHSAAAIGLFA
jgi:hypothetical protein